MIRKEKKGIVWLEFNLLQPYSELTHGVFLRHGGVSLPPFGSLNLGENTGDKAEAVAENRQRVKSLLELPHLLGASQVHGHQIHEVSHENLNVKPECDALVTWQGGVGLLVQHADCQAAIFYDPETRVVANVHCGWRGHVHNIYAKTVAYFHSHFGTSPKDLLVCISPSLGPEAAEFVNFQEEIPEPFHRFQTRPTRFDLWAIAKWQLEVAGVDPKHIEIAKECTHSPPEYSLKQPFFSYRREKKTGRHGTVVGLKKNL